MGVPVDVVHPLEVVQVEHQHRDRVVGARCPGQLGPEALVEVAMVVEAGQRVRLREVLEPGADPRVVDRERGGVTEPLGELELVLLELSLRAEPVDVQCALDGASSDQRHDDQRLWLVRRPGDDGRAWVEVSAVRPDGCAVRDRPAGEPLVVGGPVVHDLFLVLRRAREHGHELAAGVVGLVDVQRPVGHQVGERGSDAIEQGVEALLRHHLVEHLREAPVGLDERLRASAVIRRSPAVQRGLCRGDLNHRSYIGGPEARLESYSSPQKRAVFGQGVNPRPESCARAAASSCAHAGQLSAVPQRSMNSAP